MDTPQTDDRNARIAALEAEISSVRKELKTIAGELKTEIEGMHMRVDTKKIDEIRNKIWKL